MWPRIAASIAIIALLGLLYASVLSAVDQRLTVTTIQDAPRINVVSWLHPASGVGIVTACPVVANDAPCVVLVAEDCVVGQRCQFSDQVTRTTGAMSYVLLVQRTDDPSAAPIVYGPVVAQPGSRRWLPLIGR